MKQATFLLVIVMYHLVNCEASSDFVCDNSNKRYRRAARQTNPNEYNQKYSNNRQFYQNNHNASYFSQNSRYRLDKFNSQKRITRPIRKPFPRPTTERISAMSKLLVTSATMGLSMMNFFISFRVFGLYENHSENIARRRS